MVSRLTSLALGLHGQVDEAAELAGGDVRFHDLGAGLGDVLELGQQRGRVQLLQHRLLHALLALDAGVVVHEFAGPAVPEGVEAVQLLVARRDPAVGHAVDAVGLIHHGPLMGTQPPALIR